MEVTNYLPFRCIIFMNESTLIVGVCRSKVMLIEILFYVHVRDMNSVRWYIITIVKGVQLNV